MIKLEQIDSKEKLELFLIDLEKVFTKHGLVISACGCCDSPWVVKGDNDAINEIVTHLRKGGCQ